MDEEIFNKELVERINNNATDKDLNESIKKAVHEMTRVKYSYNFKYLGRPVFQNPSDLHVFQEIIWEYKPDLIIETGIARGGSLIYFASMLVLLECCGIIENGEVLGIDIDIREHNKKAILEHPLSKKIVMFEGSSISKEIIDKVKEFSKHKQRILIILDSNHTHDHVLEELKAYASLVSKDGYCIVCDTGIENTDELCDDRPWGKGNSPMSAVFEFLKEQDSFEIDKFYENKSLITGAPNGFLKRVK
jgi:cephalosporin hydroxylase